MITNTVEPHVSGDGRFTPSLITDNPLTDPTSIRMYKQQGAFCTSSYGNQQNWVKTNQDRRPIGTVGWFAMMAHIAAGHEKPIFLRRSAHHGSQFLGTELLFRLSTSATKSSMNIFCPKAYRFRRITLLVANHNVKPSISHLIIFMH